MISVFSRSGEHGVLTKLDGLKINEKFLEGQVSKKRLTDFEKDMILATPQISE